MSIHALYDLQQEINRLFIAGSKFAKNDPRLLNQVAQFNKLGEKAPIFKKIANDIVDLSESEASESAEKLSNLSTLLYSILYTQGESYEAAETQTENQPKYELESIQTKHSYLELNSVIEALTKSGSGRLPVIEDSYKQGILNDFRIYPYLDFALGDKFAELSHFIGEKVIPSIGQKMLPYLLANFSYQGRPEDLRRFRAIDELGYEGIDEMIEKIFESNVTLLQVEAIISLSRNVANEKRVIEFTNDKNKAIREIAYRCLAHYGSETSLAKLKELYLQNKRKGDIGILVDAVSMTKSTSFDLEIVKRIQQTFNEFISLKDADVKEISKAFNFFQSNLLALENKDTDASYHLLASIYEHPIFEQIAKQTELASLILDLSRPIINCLDTYELKNVLSFYEKVQANNPKLAWQNRFCVDYFRKAITQLPKERIYDLFSETLVNGIIHPAILLYDYLVDKNQYYDPSRVDQRWIEKMYEPELPNIWQSYEIASMLRLCEDKNSKRLNHYLLYLLEKETYYISRIIEMMLQRKIEGRFQIIYDKIVKEQNLYILDFDRRSLWSEFPKEYAIKFRELYNIRKDETYKHIADIIEFGE